MTPSIPSSGKRLEALLAEVRACKVCEPHLPLGARPLIHSIKDPDRQSGTWHQSPYCRKILL